VNTAALVLSAAGILALGGLGAGITALVKKTRPLYLVGSTLLFAAGLLVLGWAIVDSTGVEAAGVGLVAALLPAPLLVGTFIWLGRYRRRPWLVLVFCFGWGACVSTAISLGVNTGIALWLRDAGFDPNLAAVVSAPVIEEITKLIGPLLILLVARRHLTGLLDAIVYCGLSAAGFAVAENVLYASGTYITGAEALDERAGLALVTYLVILRGLATMFAHPLMTGLSAIGLGMAARIYRWRTTPGGAKLRPLPGRSIAWILGMLLCGMALHALWNGSAVFAEQIGAGGLWFAVYLAFLVPLFFTMVGVALWLRAADARRTQTTLAPFVGSGVLAPPELASLASFSRRSSARAWARRVAGKDGARAMRDFQQAASDLSEHLNGASQGGPYDPNFVGHTVARMDAARAGYVGRDPAMPRALWDGSRYHVTFPDGRVRPVDPPALPVMPLPVQVPQAPPQPPAAYPGAYV
jgi:protease PrsW